MVWREGVLPCSGAHRARWEDPFKGRERADRELGAVPGVAGAERVAAVGAVAQLVGRGREVGAPGD
jgi:hypothetical protein